MVDFAEWVVAAEPSLPFEEGLFLKVFTTSQAEQRIDMMEGHVLAGALRLLAKELDHGQEYADCAENVRKRLFELALYEGLNIKDYSFPKYGRALSQYLRRDKEAYERVSGLKIKMDPRDRDSDNRKLIRFRKAVH